jgi:hypothetical protein
VSTRAVLSVPTTTTHSLDEMFDAGAIGMKDEGRYE